MQILNGVLQEQFCTQVGTAKKKNFSLKKIFFGRSYYKYNTKSANLIENNWRLNKKKDCNMQKWIQKVRGYYDRGKNCRQFILLFLLSFIGQFVYPLRGEGMGLMGEGDMP